MTEPVVTFQIPLEDLLDRLTEKLISKLPKISVAKPDSQADELFTIQQVANFLNLSVQTIYGYVSRSEIPCMKKGKRLYFSKQEINAWLKTGRKKTIAEINSEVDNSIKMSASKKGTKRK